MITANQQTRTLIFISMLLSWPVCQDPIISTWYIGTRVSGVGPYNHYIELYNPTEEMINLGEYALIKGHGQTNNLEGQEMWGNTLGNSGVSFLRLPSDVISPAIKTILFLIIVSQATLLFGSSDKYASKTASEI